MLNERVPSMSISKSVVEPSCTTVPTMVVQCLCFVSSQSLIH